MSTLLLLAVLRSGGPCWWAELFWLPCPDLAGLAVLSGWLRWPDWLQTVSLSRLACQSVTLRCVHFAACCLSEAAHWMYNEFPRNYVPCMDSPELENVTLQRPSRCWASRQNLWNLFAARSWAKIFCCFSISVIFSVGRVEQYTVTMVLWLSFPQGQNRGQNHDQKTVQKLFKNLVKSLVKIKQCKVV